MIIKIIIKVNTIDSNHIVYIYIYISALFSCNENTIPLPNPKFKKEKRKLKNNKASSIMKSTFTHSMSYLYLNKHYNILLSSA